MDGLSKRDHMIIYVLVYLVEELLSGKKMYPPDTEELSF